MAESGMFRTPALQGWQRTNVVAAANYLREQLARNPDDPRLRAAYEGLLDLLDPSRMLARRQREKADAAKHAAVIKQERRRSGDRRRMERRASNLGPPGGRERRTGG